MSKVRGSENTVNRIPGQPAIYGNFSEEFHNLTVVHPCHTPYMKRELEVRVWTVLEAVAVCVYQASSSLQRSLDW